jgi:hypothetical protein
MKDENGDLLAYSHNILNRWRNYFSHLMSVHNVNDVRQIVPVPVVLRLKLLLQS